LRGSDSTDRRPIAWIAVGGASATLTVSCANGAAVSHGAMDVAGDDVADYDDVARIALCGSDCRSTRASVWMARRRAIVAESA
jgi:hypothetical protein